ncbi:MAG: ATP-binding cassette domain-containing protein [Promethearchaeota archaeon]
MSELLRLENVYYELESQKILTNINVAIEENGITGIIGPSGAGKSTILRLLNKLISPTYGKIFFKGKNYDEIPARLLRKEIGLVQQSPNLFDGTVRMNLEYGPRIWNIKYSDDNLNELLSEVALPSEFLDRNVEGLSGGEQQRVNLARSLANKPTILLLDEPTSALDILSEEIVEHTLRTIAKKGIKIVIVTHSLEQTQRLTDHLICLRDGQLVEKTTTEHFFQNYSEEEIRRCFKEKEMEKEVSNDATN